MPKRAEALRAMEPQLIADLTLYPTSEGGKKLTIQLGYGCPCLVSTIRSEPDDGDPRGRAHPGAT